MQNEDHARSELLDAMAFVFLYSSDPSQLDPTERASFRDDIVRILNSVEREIALSKIEIQRNWFMRAKEKIEEGLILYDRGDYSSASKNFGQSEDIFRSGMSAHERKTDFIVAPDGVIRNEK